jgi:60 kDa SS-A/Ro ribonucleoprotein
MATLNKTKPTVKRQIVAKEITSNYEGAVAYKLADKQALIEKTVGAFWNEDLFYSKGKKQSNETVELIKKVASVDPKFPLQLAAYARNELYLRTTPQVILTECANIEGCKPFIREYTPKIVKRADELAEVIAYQLETHGKPIPNSLKKGLAAAFATFDEYQLNKYDSDKGAVKLGDVLRLIYRKEGYPVSKAMYNYLVNDEVDADALPKIAALKQMLSLNEWGDEARILAHKSNATWETLTSKFGSSKEVWETASASMGYMAKLRNLRNFVEKGVDLDPILEYIRDPQRVAKSKQLPFRFYSAYKQRIGNTKVQRAIAQAFEASVTNVGLKGSSAILVDESGSMGGTLSDKSSITYAEVGAVLAAIAAKKAEESIAIAFATGCVQVSFNPDDTMMTNIEQFLAPHKSGSIGGGTDTWKAFTQLGTQKVDRVILISDCQAYDTGSWGGYAANHNVQAQWEAYRKNVNPNARLYSIDVSAYGTANLPSTDGSVTRLFGWSDKVLDYIGLLENKVSMEAEIAKY